jgi:hypothetical protein
MAQGWLLTAIAFRGRGGRRDRMRGVLGPWPLPVSMSGETGSWDARWQPRGARAPRPAVPTKRLRFRITNGSPGEARPDAVALRAG